MATLAQIQTRIRQRSNNEYTNGQFVTDAELTGLINVSYKHLYGTLVEHSMHRSETTYTITATGAATYDLPDNLFSLLNVFRYENARYRYRLSRFSDRMKPGPADQGDASHYRVRGSALVLWPNPTSGTYEVEYIPIPEDLSADDDELDGILGWEEWVVLDVSSKVLVKEGSLEEAQLCMQERDALLRKIEDQANLAEFSETRVIENVRGGGYRDEGDWWPRGGYRGPLR